MGMSRARGLQVIEGLSAEIEQYRSIQANTAIQETRIYYQGRINTLQRRIDTILSSMEPAA